MLISFGDSGYSIPKDSFLRRSDWSRPLTPRQLTYAATDAAVSLFIFHQLVEILNRAKIDENLFYAASFAQDRDSRSNIALENLIESFLLS